MKVTLAAITFISLASAFCHDSVSCALGGDQVCSNICVRQGNPKGGRCLPRDGCPGDRICACNSRKRGNVDGDEQLGPLLRPFFQAVGDDEAGEKDLEDRSIDNSLEKRSICCSFPPPFGGLCCEDHCAYIGKPGGQCSDKSVCRCN